MGYVVQFGEIAHKRTHYCYVKQCYKETTTKQNQQEVKSPAATRRRKRMGKTPVIRVSCLTANLPFCSPFVSSAGVA